MWSPCWGFHTPLIILVQSETLYLQGLKAMDGQSSERLVSFTEPIMTNTLVIKPKQSNVYAGFRLKIIGCAAEGEILWQLRYWSQLKS